MNFKDRYINYSNEELIEIIIQKDNYQEKAVEIALEIIKERKIVKELAEELRKIELENEKIEQIQFEEYEKVKDINLSNKINVKIGDVAKFEGELIKQNIKFHREDKNITAGFEVFPSEDYYFSIEDFPKADKIFINLGLLTASQDIKPFFKFEIKVILLIAFIIIIALIFFL